MQCPSCSRSVSEGASYCSGCGSPLAAPDAEVGATSQSPTAVARGTAAATETHPSLDDSRFLPGTLLGGRYRIVSLIGRGGMGEVYRADDLKLGERVALKFLPEEARGDSERLRSFLSEVRLARKISHPNVCRVYDVGEVEGSHFLSMQFIDGEDLQTLLRRIGRLPRGKASQIGQEICAGLAAAHQLGVLHRDLKPANVMIDGRGRARIADFGLAALAGEVGNAGAGTPAYMAPEQLAAKEVTARSDLYALGLVLYELFTGKRPFEADSRAELVRRQTDTTPERPSERVEGLDATTDRIILRCLEAEPEARPTSALEVAAALPGGDPLRAALDAGEIPSPEMVANVAETGALRPATAITLAGSFLALLVTIVLLAGKTHMGRVVSLPESPEVLTVRARDLARDLGYDPEPPHRGTAFTWNREHVRELIASNSGQALATALESGRPPIVLFSYRQSPTALLSFPSRGRLMTRLRDPPTLPPGRLHLDLDPRGRLWRLEARAPVDGSPPAPEASLERLFAAAGLERAELEPAELGWAPDVFADRLATWSGRSEDATGKRTGVGAAFLGGYPVAFEILDPRPVAPPARPVDRGLWASAASVLNLAYWPAALVVITLVARLNLRLGRGDRAGAARLSLTLFAASLLGWALGTLHVVAPVEVDSFDHGLSRSLLTAAVVGFGYLAVEPFVRRYWPRRVVSWARLLDGRVADPLVGRDLLIGCLTGVGFGLIAKGTQIWTVAQGGIVLFPVVDFLDPLTSFRHALANLTHALTNSVAQMLVFVTVLVVARMLLRRDWIAVAAIYLFFLLLFGTSPDQPGLVYTVLVVTLGLAAFFRVGLLALVVGGFVSAALFTAPLTLNPEHWFLGRSLLTLVTVTALAGYGAFRSVAGSPTR